MQVGAKKLKFLGCIISESGIQIDPAKINFIKHFSIPQNAKKVHNFLGLVNFSIQFVPHLATISQPLRVLLQKGVPFKWYKQRQESFQQLKDLIE